MYYVFFYNKKYKESPSDYFNKILIVEECNYILSILNYTGYNNKDYDLKICYKNGTILYSKESDSDINNIVFFEEVMIKLLLGSKIGINDYIFIFNKFDHYKDVIFFQ